MEQFKLFRQVRQILSPVTFRAPDTLMPSHVLNLPDIICFEPVHYHTCPELPAVYYFRMYLLYRFHYFTDHVAVLLRQEDIGRLQVSFFKQLLTGFFKVGFNW